MQHEAGTGAGTGAGEGTGIAPRVVSVGVSLVVVLVLVLSAIVLVRSSLPGAQDCTVTVGGRTVELGRDDSEDAATLAARGVRNKVAFRTTTARLGDALHLSDRDAVAVASSLTGRSRRALTCSHGGSDADEESDRLSSSGLTKRAGAVRRDLERAFGGQKVGGFAPGGVTTGHTAGSAHYEGRAVDVFFRPVSPRNKTRGWAIAQYLVAHAERLSVNTVIFDGRIWTDRRSSQGWRSYQPDTSGRSAQTAAVLEHRDHVHVDVAD